MSLENLMEDMAARLYFNNYFIKRCKIIAERVLRNEDLDKESRYHLMGLLSETKTSLLKDKEYEYTEPVDILKHIKSKGNDKKKGETMVASFR